MIIGRPPSVRVPIVVIEIWASGFCTHKITHRASDISWKKKQNFAGFSGANSRKNRPISREKSQNSRENRLILRDFLIPRLGNKENSGSNKIETWFKLTTDFIYNTYYSLGDLWLHWDSYLVFRHFLNTLNASVARIFLNIILEKLVIWSNVNVKFSLTIRKIALSSKFTSFLCVHVHNLHFCELCINNLK